MAQMILGLVLFLGAHSARIFGFRRPVVAAVGEGPYKALYGIASLAGLVLTARGYGEWRAAGPAILYTPPAWFSHIALLLMLVAFILLAATYAPGYIKRAVKHPMLTAVKTWALAHLLANGDAASVTLFGAFLVWAVADRISVKRRERAGELHPTAFTPRVSADVMAVGIGAILYALFVWKLHLWLIGVSPVAMPL